MGKFRTLDLFSGIGGFSLGLERTGGFETVAFCEIDRFCRRVLAKHWHGVPIYDDIRTLTADQLRADGIAVDAICGGFPCQDISAAGKGAGLAGERSGLWSGYARLIGELRPRYVIVENVAALLSRGLDKVLGDLAAIGFDAEWHCIPASAIGAPHRRDRVWIVAYPDGQREQQPERRFCEVGGWVGDGCKDVADAKRWGLESGDVECSWPPAIIPAAYGGYRGGSEFGTLWRTEPSMGRVAYGVPNGMDRLRSLGNAVVPQIPELIGRAILAAERVAS